MGSSSKHQLMGASTKHRLMGANVEHGLGWRWTHAFWWVGRPDSIVLLSQEARLDPIDVSGG